MPKITKIKWKKKRKDQTLKGPFTLSRSSSLTRFVKLSWDLIRARKSGFAKRREQWLLLRATAHILPPYGLASTLWRSRKREFRVCLQCALCGEPWRGRMIHASVKLKIKKVWGGGRNYLKCSHRGYQNLPPNDWVEDPCTYTAEKKKKNFFSTRRGKEGRKEEKR